MKATKKLIGASCALVAALAVSVGSTFAWFTTNNRAEVSNISANVTSSDSSLEMKLAKSTGEEIAGQEWGYSLDLKDYFTGVTLEALTYKSSAQGLATRDGASKVGAPTMGDDGKLSSGNYVEFYLVFRSPKKFAIYLDADSKVTGQESESRDMITAWETIESGTYGNSTEIKMGDVLETTAKNAVRVGFEAASSKTDAAESDYTSKQGVWAPNESAGADNGFYHATNNLAKDYEINVLKVEDAEEKYNCAYTPGITNGGKASESSLIATMGDEESGYHYAYVHVVMWIEGTDGDCFNNIFGDTVTLQLKFEAKEVT